MKIKKNSKSIDKISNIDNAQHLMMNAPISTLIASMELQLNVLKSRGVEIRDFDNKSKKVEQIRMIGNKAYFLAIDDITKE